MKHAWKLVAGLVVVTLFACGGGDSKSTDAVEPQDLATEDVVADVAPQDTVEPEDLTVNCPSENWAMEFFGITDGMTIETGESMLIQARIFDTVLGQVVEGTPVTFTLTGDGDAELTETKADTNDLGVAAVNLNTGTALGVDYTVTASNPCTGSLELTLTTIAPEQGKFMVTFALSQDLTDMWGDLDVVAFADNTIQLCGGVDYTKPGSQGVPLPAGGATVEFTQVQANAAYVVFGVAYNDDGVPVGGGCTDMVSVLPDKTKEVDVAIEALAMNPSGGYQLTVQVSVKDLLGDNWQDVGAVVQQIMDNAAQSIGQKVLDDILIYFPDGLPECPEGDAADDIQASIDAGVGSMDTALTDWVADNADAWLTQLLGNVVIKGKLMVEETEQNQVWSAKWTVESVRFTGTIDCGEADCESWQLFLPETFGVGDVHLELDQHTLELAATGFDTLAVSPVELPIEPGKLTLFAFNNIVLKKQGLSNELVELFTETFSCNTLLSKVTAPTIACINKPQTQLIESCNKAVEAMAGAVYNELADYTAAQVLDTEGSLTSEDDDNDLTVDGLSGTLDGDYLIGGEAAGTFSLPFSASKL